MKKIIFLLFVGLSIVSCNTAAPISDFSRVKQLIESNTWILQDEAGTVYGFNGKEVNLRFRNENGLMASGYAGCNNYSGSANILPDKIVFGEMMMTAMACSEMDNERSFVDLLQIANGYEVSQNELRFYQDKVLLLRFKSQ